MDDSINISLFDGDLVAIMAAIIYSQMNIGHPETAKRAVDHAKTILRVVQTGK